MKKRVQKVKKRRSAAAAQVCTGPAMHRNGCADLASHYLFFSQFYKVIAAVPAGCGLTGVDAARTGTKV